jgi:hypothetical protein
VAFPRAISLAWSVIIRGRIRSLTGFQLPKLNWNQHAVRMGDKRAEAQSMLSSNACRTVQKVRPRERLLTGNWQIKIKRPGAE